MVNWRFGIRIGVPPSNKQSLPQGDPRNPNHLAPNHPWKPLAGSWHFQKKGQIKVSIEKQFFSLTLYTGCMFQKAPCNDLQWGVVDVIYIYIYLQPTLLLIGKYVSLILENTSLSYKSTSRQRWSTIPYIYIQFVYTYSTHLICFLGCWPSTFWVKSSKRWFMWVLGMYLIYHLNEVKYDPLAIGFKYVSTLRHVIWCCIWWSLTI